MKETDEDTDGEPVQRRRSTQRRMDNMIIHHEDGTVERPKRLSWRRRLQEFYSAPITTFWMWSLAYAVFMIALIYMLLVETPRRPTWVEWYLFSYVVVWACEVIRKVGHSLPYPIIFSGFNDHNSGYKSSNPQKIT